MNPDYLGIPDYEIGPGAAPGAAGDRARFLDAFVKQKMADDLAYAQYQQAQQKAQIDPREVMAAELATEQAKAKSMGAEAGVRSAEEENIRARTALLNDPAAMAMKQGTATAEQTLAFRARIREQALKEINPADVDRMAAEMVVKRQAGSIADARQMVTEALIGARVKDIVASDPQLQRYFISETGGVGGAGG
jgi:hypothetical protein